MTSLIYASKYNQELKFSPGNAGIDLRTPNPIYLPFGYETKIDTGIRAKLFTDKPAFILIVPRSSAGSNYGLYIKNTVGVIDPTYCGDDDSIIVHLARHAKPRGRVVGWRYALENANGFIGMCGGTLGYDRMTHTTEKHDNVEYLIELQAGPKSSLLYNPGDRFAQMIVLPYEEIESHELVKRLEDEANRGGFGSTGVK